MFLEISPNKCVNTDLILSFEEVYGETWLSMSDGQLEKSILSFDQLKELLRDNSSIDNSLKQLARYQTIPTP